MMITVECISIRDNVPEIIKVGNKYKIPIDARFPAKDYGMQEGQTEVYFET